MFIRSAWLAGAATLALAVPAAALTQTGVVVAGTSNIFAVGDDYAPSDFLQGGTEPVTISFAAGSGFVLTIANATGGITCCTGGVPAGPDGAALLGDGNTDVDSARGIAGGSDDDLQAFLVGVFVNSLDLPTTGTPTKTDFTGLEGEASYSPALNAAFYIGDGLTGTGTGDQQIFYVPDGADMLVLGFLDSGTFVGYPSYYDDNEGAVTVDVTIASAVPTPAALPLAAAGIGALAMIRRRRRG